MIGIRIIELNRKTRLGFLSFSFPKNKGLRNSQPLFSVHHVVLALDKLLPSRAYLHPHTDKQKYFNKFEKSNINGNFNIWR